MAWLVHLDNNVTKDSNGRYSRETNGDNFKQALSFSICQTKVTLNLFKKLNYEWTLVVAPLKEKFN